MAEQDPGTIARPRVVVLGGGFGGLAAARSLRRAPVEVSLVDRRNFHLFQPLLYQVATGGLSPANIAAPLRRVLRRQRNARVLLGEAVGLDARGRRLLLGDGEVPYDFLVVAAGARHHYFDRPEWEAHAPGLKTLEDANEIRRRILVAFECAERAHDPGEARAWLTFVVAGGGATGVELAGALAEIARDSLRRDFRSIDPASARILLVEGSERILAAFRPELAAKAARSLERLGVAVRTGARIVDVREDGVTLAEGGREERVAAQTVLWAAGTGGEAFGRVLAREAGALLDAAGRVTVGPDLAIPGRPEILVIGDLARFEDPGGNPLPGLAPVAIQQGRHAARVVLARIRGEPPPPFRYRNPGVMATVGRSAAVVDLWGMRFNGWPAWVTWLFVHLMMLVEHESRVLVFVQWAWNYFTFNRSARLITGEGADALPSRAGRHPGRYEPAGGEDRHWADQGL